MDKKIKYIVREVPPEHTDFSYYFDNDGLTEAGGDYCYNLFIVAQSRRSSGFNEEEYQNLQNEIENLLEMYEDITNKSDYAQYSSVGAMLFDLGLVNSIHNTDVYKRQLLNTSTLLRVIRRAKSDNILIASGTSSYVFFPVAVCVVRNRIIRA